MKNSFFGLGILVVALLLAGCSRGQNYDSNQVRTVQDANGTSVQRLMLPIRGKPFASGAQWVYDQLVASQPGGDIQKIVVDPASVVVVASQLGYGQGIFIMTGRAHVILAHGQGEFDAHFRESLEGGCLDDRVLSSCAAIYMPVTSAYTIPLDTWKQTIASSRQVDANDYITSELSIDLLVQQITAAGSVDLAKLTDWKQANQIAWKSLGSVPFGWGA
jgi:hypothetical protein